MKTIHSTLQAKPLQIRLSDAAWQALRHRTYPLAVEMQLLFGCLIKKRVHFPQQHQVDDSAVESFNVPLILRYRTVTTQSCRVDEQNQNRSQLVDLPSGRLTSFVPTWLELDFKQGDWSGRFGY